MGNYSFEKKNTLDEITKCHVCFLFKKEVFPNNNILKLVETTLKCWHDPLEV